MSADDTVRRFLGTQNLRPASHSRYGRVLRHFDTAVPARGPARERLSTATLRAWLLAEIRRSTRKLVMDRVFIIARYLNWRSAAAGEPSPLAVLSDRYGGRLTPIVRALLESDYETALERLRPLPEYGSTLGPAIREHVERMRSLGCKYDTKARDLKRFDRFLQSRSDLAGAPLSVVLDAWAHSAGGVRHQLRVQQCGRALSQALRRHDATTAVMSIDVGLQRRVLQEERRPYLFTDGEIQQIFVAARTYPSPHAPLRPIALHTMVTLAYCVGLRIGEIVKLTVGDVNLGEGLLEIRDTKFFKSRRLPLAPSVLKALSGYLHERAAAGAPTSAAASLWWTPARRQAYSYGMAEELLTSVLRRAGLKPARGSSGPRVHDLRHTFVAHRMLQWYRDGVDPQTRLPHLATYLGHKDIQSTLVYLNITPEVLQQASERYRRHGADALGAAGGRP